MMKQLLLLTVCLVFLPLTICGQEEQNEEEYDYIEKTMKIWPEDDNKYNVTTGAPIVTTSPFSQSETLYCMPRLVTWAIILGVKWKGMLPFGCNASI